MSISTMQHSSAADDPDFSLIAKRNCSLQNAERWRAFWLVALVSGLIAVGFAAIGAWLILPFAGLELAALYAAFRQFERGCDDYERIQLRGDYLLVESCTGGRSRRFQSNKHWTQVVVSRTARGCRVAIRSQGRQIEFGALLNDEERAAAARQLQKLLRIQG
jgi:uncharacterized membrane protein